MSGAFIIRDSIPITMLHSRRRCHGRWYGRLSRRKLGAVHTLSPAATTLRLCRVLVLGSALLSALACGGESPAGVSSGGNTGAGTGGVSSGASGLGGHAAGGISSGAASAGAAGSAASAAGDTSAGGIPSGGAAGLEAGGGAAGASAGSTSGGVGSGGGASTAGTGGAAGSAGGAGNAGGAGSAGAVGNGALIHPGGFFKQPDLDRIRTGVAMGSAPWAGAWAAVRNTGAGTTQQASVPPVVTDPYLLQNHGHAAYVLAIKWVASGDMAYATAAKRVLDAWVNTVTRMETDTLRTGIGAVQMGNAAEIIAHGFNGGAGWPPAQVAKARTWFKNVLWPTIGSRNPQRSSNWGTAAMAGCMATAIFSDDRDRFNYTVDAYKNGFTDAPDGCSGVTQYICEASGQATESGRDQGHPQGGVAHLVEVAFMAWNQGVDLVSYGGNRVLAGVEYHAKYNLGRDDVPYNANFADPCNVHPSTWLTISPVGRGSFSPLYEMANKLFTLADVPRPFTAQVIASAGYAPEKTNSDHPGMGTLTFR